MGWDGYIDLYHLSSTFSPSGAVATRWKPARETLELRIREIRPSNRANWTKKILGKSE